MIGPRERDRLWDRHILNCAAVAPLIPADAAVGDVGSGAGLPGIVVALLRTDVTMDLVEPLLRRTIFLEEAVEALGLSQTQVVRARAEELAGTRWYDVVTARAVAPLPTLLNGRAAAAPARWSAARPEGRERPTEELEAADEAGAAERRGDGRR